MNKWVMIALSIALVLSFALVYALSPSDEAFLARYAPGEYITVAAFDVPLDIIPSTVFRPKPLPSSGGSSISENCWAIMLKS